jgi:hypothetical protein
LLLLFLVGFCFMLLTWLIVRGKFWNIELCHRLFIRELFYGVWRHWVSVKLESGKVWGFDQKYFIPASRLITKISADENHKYILCQYHKPSLSNFTETFGNKNACNLQKNFINRLVISNFSVLRSMNYPIILYNVFERMHASPFFKHTKETSPSTVEFPHHRLIP